MLVLPINVVLMIVPGLYATPTLWSRCQALLSRHSNTFHDIHAQGGSDDLGVRI